MTRLHDPDSYARKLKSAVRSYVRACGVPGATPAEVARGLKANGPAVLKAMTMLVETGELAVFWEERRVGQAVYKGVDK